MKTVITIATLIFSVSSLANDASEQYWDVRAFEEACVSSNHIMLWENRQDPDDRDPIGHVYLDFSIPNNKVSRYELENLASDEKRMFLSIQPGGVWHEETDKISDLKVATNTKTYSASEDKKFHDLRNPRFLVVGDAAGEIWDEIVEGNSVSIDFEHSNGKHYSINVGGKFLDRISRMFEACAS